MKNAQRETQTPWSDAAEPLDAFEHEWVSVLRQQDGDIAETEDAFVDAVLEQAEQAPATPPVLARIGWAPLVAAAAVALAGAVTWAALFSSDNAPGTAPIVEQPAPSPEFTDSGSTLPDIDDPSPRHAPRTEQERRALAQSLQLGTMIADTSGTFSRPAAGLPKTISNTSDQLSLKSLTQGITNPVPDPAEVLPPRRNRPRG
ncbi:MAG: hypothetical protein AAGA29_01690 [Planctomycetota bacterium]